MPAAMLEPWEGEDDARSVLFPNSRAGAAAPARPAPVATSALEAYAQRTMSEGDAEFSRYLLKFLQDFASVSNRATVRPMTIMSLAAGTSASTKPVAREDLGRASIVAALKAEPEHQAHFRVPPFALALPEDASDAIPDLDATPDALQLA